MRSILNTFILAFAMVASSTAYAVDLGSMIGNYLANKQNNNGDKKAAVAKGLMQTYGSNQVQLSGIELTQEWQDIYNMMQEAAGKANENMVNAGQKFDFCYNPYVLNQMNEKPKNFDYSFNSKLPRQASMPSKTFDYGTFRELNRSKVKFGLEALHIPNANSVNARLNIAEGGNVYENSSAIMLPKVLINEVKNQYNILGRNYLVDSKNMQVATFRDIATIGYIIVKNPQLKISFEDFFMTSMLIYSRNKVLCLYDAPI